jgi:hypothetical protein
MLGYAVFVLIALLFSVIAIWLYRLVSGGQGYEHNVLDRNNQTVGKKITTQFGYISSFLAHRKKNKIEDSAISRVAANLPGVGKNPHHLTFRLTHINAACSVFLTLHGKVGWSHP